jgi:mono/diheme cytochrome c family protein
VIVQRVIEARRPFRRRRRPEPRALLAVVIVAGSVSAAVAQPIAEVPYGNPARGRTFALQVCTQCHLVERGQPGPQRVVMGPGFRDIANARTTTSRSVRAFLYAPHANMPNLRLSRSTADDVIAYIMTLRTRPNSPSR